MTKPNKFQLEHSKEALKKQPYLKDLRKLLLSYGGNLVCDWNDTRETDVILLSKMGMLWSTNGLVHKQMEINHCHDNSEYLQNKNPKRYKWITGFVLSDSLWLPHSWVYDIKYGNIIETTCVHKKYFGFIYPLFSG